jgi:hypothetical protein
MKTYEELAALANQVSAINSRIKRISETELALAEMVFGITPQLELAVKGIDSLVRLIKPRIERLEYSPCLLNRS